MVIACMKSRMKDVLLAGLDARLAALRQGQSGALLPARGWLRAVRSVLSSSQAKVAQKVSVTRQSYADLEAAEERGAISLKSLQRAAEAMDCELVYYLVPRASIAPSFSELARRHDPAFRHLQASEHSMALENQAVGDLPPKR
jgi:predicted DNA-binding mobile mystery protein A